MYFTEVTTANLSNITHKVLLSEHPRFGVPEFKIIKFIGSYRHGSAGADDELYIRAACEAAHAAWYSEANIIDFTDLEYHWGDEIERIFSFGYEGANQCQHPLAVVVSEKCRKALQSLLTEEYEDYCRDTLDKAIGLAQEKKEVRR